MDFAPNEVVAARIKDARKRKRLDQKDLAETLGVTQPAVSAWESAEQMPKRETWAAVAHALDMDIIDLFFDTDDETAG